MAFVIKPPDKEKVILLPKTVDYYQIELTRMLEAGQYGDAVQLLRFLLKCKTDDERLDDEWQALLDWLETAVPEQPQESDEDSESETDLFRQHLRQKTVIDSKYAENLLDTLLHHTSVEKKMLALEQLAYIEHPEIDNALHHWIENSKLHPIVQFRVLQILKSRGMKGKIKVHKESATAVVDIEETPPSFEQFPPQINEIVARVQRISEVNNPALFYFAEQTWHEFLAFIYGTPVYDQLLSQEEQETDVWAAAFHWMLLESMFDTNGVEEIKELYGITSDLTFSWERAFEVMNSFSRSVLIRK